MRAAELIHHRFPWEIAPGVPADDADHDGHEVEWGRAA
jgi:hypothetical protein